MMQAAGNIERESRAIDNRSGRSDSTADVVERLLMHVREDRVVGCSKSILNQCALDGIESVGVIRKFHGNGARVFDCLDVVARVDEQQRFLACWIRWDGVDRRLGLQQTQGSSQPFRFERMLVSKAIARHFIAVEEVGERHLTRLPGEIEFD